MSLGTGKSSMLVLGRALTGATTNPKQPIARVVGTVDVHGKGTLHPLHDVDPFVLTDYAELKGKGLPPFGMHPHYGVIACSILIEGEYQDSDNLGASPPGNLLPGGVYAASSGKGVCHDETSAADFNRLFQVVVRTPPSKLSIPPQITKAKASELPSVDISFEASSSSLPVATLLLGELQSGGVRSPATPDAWPDAVVLRVKVPAGTKASLPIPERHEHGFAFVVDGEGEVAGEPVRKEKLEALLFGPGGTLEVAAGMDTELDMLVASGAPMREEPWVKKLGNNGFGVFRNEQEASEIMEKITSAGMDWSFKVLE